MLEDYLYHTINKDIENIDVLYETLEKIISMGGLYSNRNQHRKSIDATYNGDDYICLLKYVPYSEYKVYKMSKDEFENSNLKDEFDSYKEYLDALKLDEFKEEPISKLEYMVKNKTQDKRDYFDYLDSISNMYPIDLRWLYESTGEDIYKVILDKVGVDHGYFNANENTFYKFVLNSTGITLMFNKDIKYTDTILIPNLPFVLEEEIVREIQNMDKRYSNLIGEVQVKDKVPINYLNGIILRNEVSKDKIKDILNKYNIVVPLYKLDGERLVLIND